MLVISDTGPIVSLLKAQRLDLLHGLYGQVVIPESVYRELGANARYADEAELVANSGFIVRRSPSNVEAAQLLRQAAGLDEGESDAIALVKELDGDLLLIDDRRGRQAASSAGIVTVGSVGILLDAFEADLLTADEVKECASAFREYGRHIGDELYKWLFNELDNLQETKCKR